MKRKLVPPFLMLFAGAVISIVMFRGGYDIISMLWVLLGVLIVFYLLGSLIKKMLDVFEEQNRVEEEPKEGEDVEAGEAEEPGEDLEAEKDAEDGKKVS